MASDHSSTVPRKDTAFINGRIYTLNGARPWASGLVVSPEGVFTHVGTTNEIWAQAQKDHLITVDLKNQFVMPGIHDAHMHLLTSGLALTSNVVIEDNSTSENIASKIHDGACKCEYLGAYQDWIMAGVYSNQGFPNGVADREYLDKKFPNQPIVVAGGAGHSQLLNTTALERAGYNIANEPDVQGSRFFRRDDGSLTGELGETALTKAALSLPSPDITHVKRVLKEAIKVAHKAGVTSCQDASSNTLLLHALQEMEKEQDLRMNISTHIVYSPEFLAQESRDTLHPLLDAADQFKSKHVDTRFVKIILDGVPLPPLYSHSPLQEDGTADKERLMILNIKEALKKYDAKGMTMKIHCTGQGATRLALDAIEEARKSNPGGPKHEIAHNSGVHDDDYKRYAPLNVTAEMSPAMFFVSPVTNASNGLMDWNFPKMIANNAFLTIGSDWGAAPDPTLFGYLANVVETIGGGSKAKGGEMLCRMLTLQGAQAVGKEKEVGSIEVGKKANFIVLNKDLNAGEFKGAKVLKTYFEGEKVWEAEQ